MNVHHLNSVTIYRLRNLTILNVSEIMSHVLSGLVLINIQYRDAFVLSTVAPEATISKKRMCFTNAQVEKKSILLLQKSRKMKQRRRQKLKTKKSWQCWRKLINKLERLKLTLRKRKMLPKQTLRNNCKRLKMNGKRSKNCLMTNSKRITIKLKSASGM